ALELGADGRAQLWNAADLRVFRLAPPHRLERGVLDALGRVEIRLARTERDHVDAAGPQLARLGLHGEGRRRRQRLEAVGQHHLTGNFSVSRFSTTGGTMPATDVPKLATSLMSRDEMYVYLSCGIRNTVSTLERSLRFMSAIWNSYSKSDTARMPRTMQSA